jgi:transposase-like protein
MALLEPVLTRDCKLRRVKYLNNIIEQERGFIKKRVRVCLGYCSIQQGERCTELKQ